MKLTNSQFDEIMSIYYKRQFQCQNTERMRLDEIHRQIPEYRALEQQISELSLQHAQAKLQRGQNTGDLEQQIREITKQKEDLLTSHGLSGRLSAAGLCMPGLSGHRIHRYCQVPLSGKRDRDLSLLPVQSPADSRKREFCPFQSGLLLRRLYGRIHRTNTEREYEKHSQYRQGFCQKL